MKFRLLATIMAVLAGAHTARAQAMFPPETDNAALRYWFALAEVWEPPDDVATRHLFEEMVAGRVAWATRQKTTLPRTESDRRYSCSRNTCP
jgi:hypothetical protein